MWWCAGWGLALGATAEQTEDQLDRAVVILRQAARKPGPKTFSELPPWVDLSFSSALPDPGDSAVLQRALAHKDPLERALAVRFIAARHHPADLLSLESVLEDTTPVGFLPMQQITQQVAVSYPVEWISVTVSDVALRSIGQITGETYGDPADYARWRADHPDPARSPDVWAHVLSTSADPDSWLAALDPETAIRILWLTGDEVDNDDLRPKWRETIGLQRTLELVQRRERWPEHADPEVFARFIRWAVFELPTEALEALWQDPAATPPHTRAALACALGSKSPSQREAVLVSVLGDPSSGPVQQPLTELVRHHADSQHALLVRFLSMPDGTIAADQGRTAILTAIAERQREGKPLLVSLFRESHFQSTDPTVVEALAAAAQSTGLVGSPCEGPFHARALKGQPANTDVLTDLLLRRQRCVNAVRLATN